ncbi:MAG: hypothetical protein H0W72_08055 [Planctomycetes bacterium]|nr:hypothetical protein [Planctomycetota bacterium]
MKCFLHTSADAVGSCKFCHKGLCAACVGDSGYGLACSESCKAELLSIKDMMTKSKMLYGQTKGRFPILAIMLVSMGGLFSVIGLASIKTGRGIFPLGIGLLFLMLGVLALINQRRSGIRS